MLKTELLELIANGENSGVEFKRDDCRPEELAIEIVALANHKGGIILLGVEDDGTTSGIRKDRLEEWVMNIFSDKVHPWILPYYEEIKIDDSTRVAAISLSQGISKPYVLRHSGREEIYIRIGSTSRRATREQQARLFATGGLLHSELLPVSGSGFDSLDVYRLTDYINNIIGDTAKPGNDEEWIKRLTGMGLMSENEHIPPCCTIAGLVIFGLRPRSILKQAGIRVTVYKGTEKDYATKLDKVLDGSIVGLWEHEAGKGRVMIGDGLIEHFIDMIEPYISNDTLEEGDIRRERKYIYPLEAIREIIVNALVHRDWTRSVDIEVSIYADRMEIISPGGLQNSMTIEKMLAGQRSHRNPVLVETTRDYGYMEARGMGIRKKVLPLIREASGRDPEFIETDDYLKTILFPLAAINR
ncbi:MAG: transcriptional regulator [Spirochaetes bacterium]|nr:MAG: transcriptional regulator [Spirochaetota bacterium]